MGGGRGATEGPRSLAGGHASVRDVRFRFGLCLYVLAAFAALGATSCAGTTRPPTGWQQGGAALVIPNARWVVMGSTVDLRPNGLVYIDGDYFITIDAAGRVYDEDNEPIALVFPDGTVRGPADESLGQVGYLHASLPGNQYAWITLTPQGPVIRYDEAGERYDFGAWIGCGQSPQTLFTCTLVTHLVGRRVIAVANVRSDAMEPSVGVGVGVGVGIPMR